MMMIIIMIRCMCMALSCILSCFWMSCAGTSAFVTRCGYGLCRFGSNKGMMAMVYSDVGEWMPEILFENDRVLVINKPSGIEHHNNEKDQSEGVLTRIRNLQREARFPYDGRLYGVHRLDKVTSGILMFAKDSESAGLISKKLREKSVTKFYFGVSSKRPKRRKQGVIKGDMIKARRGAWQLTRGNSNPAVTRFYTAGLGHLNEIFYCGHIEDEKEVLPRTAVLFQPITGRTHQLRVASKSEGMPILGDVLYGGKVGGFNNRVCLHSSALHFTLGNTIDDEICVICPPPFSHLWQGQEQNIKVEEQLSKYTSVSLNEMSVSSSELSSNLDAKWLDDSSSDECINDETSTFHSVIPSPPATDDNSSPCSSVIPGPPPLPPPPLSETTESQRLFRDTEVDIKEEFCGKEPALPSVEENKLSGTISDIDISLSRLDCSNNKAESIDDTYCNLKQKFERDEVIESLRLEIRKYHADFRCASEKVCTLVKNLHSSEEIIDKVTQSRDSFSSQCNDLQRDLDKCRSTEQNLKIVVGALRKELMTTKMELDRASRKDSKNIQPVTFAQRRVRELEKEVKQLREDLKKRNPDSISNLIKALEPSESFELRNKQRDNYIEELENKVAETKRESNKRILKMNQDNEKKYKELEKRFNLVQNQLSVLERSKEKTNFSKPNVKRLSTVHKSSQTARLTRSGKFKSKSTLKVQSDDACSTHFSNIDRDTNTSMEIPTHESISSLNRIIEGKNVKLSRLEGQLSKLSSLNVELQSKVVCLQTETTPKPNNTDKYEHDQQTIKLLQINVIRLQNKIDSLSNENNRMKLKLSNYSSLEDSTFQGYATLTRKLTELEGRAERRDEELNAAIEKAKDNCSNELRRLQIIHKEELQEKDAQIRFCREKLRQLIDRAKEIAKDKGIEIVNEH